MIVTTKPNSYEIIATPPKTGAIVGGYILFSAAIDNDILTPIRDIQNIRSGDSVTNEAMNEHGLRARNINFSFTIGEETYFLKAQPRPLFQAFHLAAQGYSIDTRAILHAADFAQALPMPYEQNSLITDKGIYLGVYEAERGCLEKTFNVFAAPENLNVRDQTNYTHAEAVDALKTLHQWHGHNGSPSPEAPCFSGDIDILGLWHLPLRDLFNNNHLSLKQTIKQDTCSSTETYLTNYKDYDGWVYYYSPRTRRIDHNLKDKKQMAVRPVRFEPYHLPSAPQ